MSSSDEPQDELLERYRQASLAEPVAPSDAVRAAILEEGRRAAAEFASSQVAEVRRARPRRWKLTALATAASLLLGALIVAPAFWRQRGGDAEGPRVAGRFKQAAAVHEPQVVTAETAPAPPVPVVPLPEAQAPKSAVALPPASLSQSFAARQHDASAAPPVRYPEQHVEISMLNRSRSAPAAMAANEIAKQASEAPSALLSAASEGDTERVSQLLEQSMFVDVRDASGRTPLMLAVDAGRLESVQLLLQRGADPNAVDRAGLTPLKYAQAKGRSAIAAVLAQAGAR